MYVSYRLLGIIERKEGVGRMFYLSCVALVMFSVFNVIGVLKPVAERTLKYLRMKGTYV